MATCSGSWALWQQWSTKKIMLVTKNRHAIITSNQAADLGAPIRNKPKNREKRPLPQEKLST